MAFKTPQIPKPAKALKSPHSKKKGKFLLELGNKECRFPVSEHLAKNHIFCGEPTNKTYCEYHQKICYKEKENENQS